MPRSAILQAPSYRLNRGNLILDREASVTLHFRLTALNNSQGKRDKLKCTC
jgi:hypothetical protein